jgi:hypothetical protein
LAFNAEPDPNPPFHSNTDPDPAYNNDPREKKQPQTGGKNHNKTEFMKYVIQFEFESLPAPHLWTSPKQHRQCSQLSSMNLTSAEFADAGSQSACFVRTPRMNNLGIYMFFTSSIVM